MNLFSEMMSPGQELIEDEDDKFGKINFNPKTDLKIEKTKNIKGPKGQQGRNFTALQTIAVESKAEDVANLSYSDDDTKVLMPVKHAPEIAEGAKMIGDYKIEKTLG